MTWWNNDNIVWVAIAVAAVALIGLGGWAMTRASSRRRDRARRQALNADVAALVAQGSYKDAAHIKQSMGELGEAFALMVQAKEHQHASILAEKLGDIDGAVKHARLDQNYRRAAFLLSSKGNMAHASIMYQRAGDHAEAAEAMSRVPDVSPLTMAQLWEDAARNLLRSDATSDPEQVMRGRKYMRLAIKAYEDAGAEDRAETYRQALNTQGVPPITATQHLPAIPENVTAQHGQPELLDIDLDPVDDELHDEPPRPTIKRTLRSIPAIKAPDSSDALLARSGISGSGQRHAVPSSGPLQASNGLGFSGAMSSASRYAARPSPDVPPPSPVPEGVEVCWVGDPVSGESTAMPTHTDRYSLEHELERDALQVVYQAQDWERNATVALHFYPGAWASFSHVSGVFEHEAGELAKLDHPRLDTAHDFGILQGRPFICRDVRDGDTLRTRLVASLAEGTTRQPLSDVLDVARALFGALAHVHTAGLVHGGVMPEQVRFVPASKASADGDAPELEVRVGLPPLTMVRSTADPTWRAANTPYVAPELRDGASPELPTPASDVYAVGALLYEMLMGSPPTPGLPPREALMRSCPDLPRALGVLIARCLSQQPRARFGSAQIVLIALERIANDAAPSKPKPAPVAKPDASAAMLRPPGTRRYAPPQSDWRRGRPAEVSPGFLSYFPDPADPPSSDLGEATSEDEYYSLDGLFAPSGDEMSSSAIPMRGDTTPAPIDDAWISASSDESTPGVRPFISDQSLGHLLSPNTKRAGFDASSLPTVEVVGPIPSPPDTPNTPIKRATRPEAESETTPEPETTHDSKP